MPTSIRRLAPADLALARALNAMFASAFEEPDTYTATPPDDAWLNNLLAKDHVIVLAALHAAEGDAPAAGETVVGGILAYELDKIEQPRREIYVYDLAVAAPHRRRGVATALLAHLRELAAERGAWVIFIQADYRDEPAVALYEKLGRREEVLHYDIAVG